MICKCCNTRVENPIFLPPRDYYCDTCYGEVRRARLDFSIRDIEDILGIETEQETIEAILKEVYE